MTKGQASPKLRPMDLHARVVQVCPNASGATLVLVANGETRSIEVRVVPADLAAGAFVRLQVGQDGAVASIARVQGPTVAWDGSGDAVRWARTSRGAWLWRRQDALRAIRQDLFDEGFLEVDTPLLVPATCPDAVIDSVQTCDGRFLITSSEYQLKRLMVGGFDRVFSLTKNFRAGDRGQLHSEEFTMLEWARCWQPLEDIEADAERFVRKAFRAVRGAAAHSTVRGQRVQWDAGPWERIDLRDALRLRLGVEVDRHFSLGSMVQGAASARLQVPESFESDRHLMISWLMDALQPHLGHPLPTFVRGWPAFLTSSAQGDPDDEGVALRSELVVGGIEIADGFGFLRDSAVQAETFARENRRRQASGKAAVPIDARYLEALGQGIAPGAGMALGVDRLIMALVDAPSIGLVQAFAQDEL